MHCRELAMTNEDYDIVSHAGVNLIHYVLCVSPTGGGRGWTC